MAQLQTRKPTGQTGWPKILVEGGDKSGKSWKVAELSASPKVGRTVVLILGEDESKWDEFAQIPGADFEIVTHDGTWTSMLGQIEAAREEAAKAVANGELPFVFAVDTATAIWEGLKDWATLRARSSKKNRIALAADPDAEIDVSGNYWNDSRRRWRQGLIRNMLTFPGIFVLLARGREVTLYENNQPVAGRKGWSVEGEKDLPFDVNCHIRLSREDRPQLVSMASVKNPIRPGIDRPRRLPDDFTLESFIFEIYGLDPANVVIPQVVEFQQELTPEDVLNEAKDPETTFDRIRWLRGFTAKAFPGVTFTEGRTEIRLLDILTREGNARLEAAKAQGGQAQAQAKPGRQQRQQQEPAATVEQLTAELAKATADLGDWGLRVEEISSADEADAADLEVSKAKEEQLLDEVKASAVHRAIGIKRELISRAAAPVADAA